MSELLKLLQAKYKTGLYTHDTIPSLERVSTGISTLDASLGGGLPLGRIIEIFGPESAGKSSICLTIAREAVRREETVLYVDLEKTISAESLEMYDLQTENFVVARPNYGEQAIDLAIDAAVAGCQLIIVDTVAMLLPKSVQDKFESDSEARDVAGPAAMINRLKNKITDHIEYNKSVLVFVNQIRDNLSNMHGGISTPGGHALKHMCSIRIRITHAVKKQDQPGRITSQVKIEKNKTFTPGLGCEIPIDSGLVQCTEALILAAVDLGLITKKGAWLYLDPRSGIDLEDSKLGQGITKASYFLDEHPNIKETLQNKVVDSFIKVVPVNV